METTPKSLLSDVQLIPVKSIRVLNSRTRDRKKFKEIMDSIAHVGLKKPITISIRPDSFIGGEPVYDLVCGQGRLEAFRALGDPLIPATVIEASKEDQLVMSLSENIVRRQPRSFEHVQQVARLRDEGYTTAEIAGKVNMDESYVFSILNLWDKGEERLIKAVEEKRIPLSTACMLAKGTDADEQSILAEAYETKKLVGKKLMAAKQVLTQRRTYGKKLGRGWKRAGVKPATSADGLVRCYQLECQKQQAFVKMATLCELRLSFVVSAVKKLGADEDFVNVLRLEGLSSLPRYLAEDAGLAL